MVCEYLLLSLDEVANILHLGAAASWTGYLHLD